MIEKKTSKVFIKASADKLHATKHQSSQQPTVLTPSSMISVKQSRLKAAGSGVSWRPKLRTGKRVTRR